MVLASTLNFFLLPNQKLTGNGNTVSGRQLSMWKLLKTPGIAIVVLTLVVAANVWAFLDPTLEPHLREVYLMFVYKILLIIFNYWVLLF